MPASEEFFRDQKKLHGVFAISAAGLLGATIWMMGADYLLEWKQYQNQWFKVRREKINDDIEAARKQQDSARLADVQAQLAKAKEDVAKQYAEARKIQAEISGGDATLLKAEESFKGAKADDAAINSQFDLMVTEIAKTREDGDAARVKLLEGKLVEIKKKVEASALKVLATNNRFDELRGVKKELEGKLAAIRKNVADLESRERNLTSDVDKLGRSRDSVGFNTGNMANDYGRWFASLPIIDGFMSPLRLRQTVHDNLPLDYNFKKVTRFDRCMTCHQGIDQAGFTGAEGVRQPFCSHPHLDLYVAPSSKHPVEKFGCTVCHQGQGSATSFAWASHTPDNSKERKEWTKEHGWFNNHFHEWPMFPTRFVEASCLKCHHDPYEIPEAKKLLLGYQTIQQQGCYGCHEISGYKDDGTAIGPNLRITAGTDTPDMKRKAFEKVGPNLKRVAEKLSPEFVASWIRNPNAFRPSTKMPHFYHQMDKGYYGEGPKDEFEFGVEPEGSKYSHAHKLENLAEAEIVAMTHYLMKTSQAYVADPKTNKLDSVKATGDAKKGKELFMTRGCVSCHNHADKDMPKLKEGRNFGPDLSQVAAKFDSPERKAWLASWIKNPAAYSPHTQMPSLQLSDQDSADIAAWLTSVPGKWEKDAKVPTADQLLTKTADGSVVDPVRDLVMSILVKSKPNKKAAAEDLAKMNREEQLSYLGKQTIGRLGCFACHNIVGFDDAKPIGVALNDWGKKDPHKLAFENAHELVEKEMRDDPNHFYHKNDIYVDAIHAHQREGFLMQKLREPRGYDFKKIRRWEDRTRMPKFNINDEEREAVATFVIGLVAEEINRSFVYNPPKPKRDAIHGMNLLHRYNCVACHVIKPGEYTMELSDKLAASLSAAGKSALDADFTEAMVAAHNGWSVDPKSISKGNKITFKGLPEGAQNPDDAENPEDPDQFFRLWYASSVKGQVVPSGLKFGAPLSTAKKAKIVPPVGGSYAFSLVDYLISKSANPNNPAERDTAWGKAPPPLIRQGERVQTNWLYRFLRDPQMIRPAVVLRMPKFNYREGDVEALANFFAAHDGVAYPYIEVGQREETYLQAKDAKLGASHLEAGWKLLNNQNLCIKCHQMGGKQPAGKPEEQGPSLVRAHERLRPDWMIRWIANPKRFAPYTAMPVNFDKTKSLYQEEFKGSSLDQAEATRDALLNYGRILETLMAKNVATAPAPATPAPGPAAAPANPPAAAPAGAASKGTN
jgi:cytochrome c2